MSFTGNTGDADRDRAQQTLSRNIGNDSTRPRSIELAIQAEAALYERMGKRTDDVYKKKVEALVSKLTDPRDGFDLNRRLLCGELAPAKWLEQEVPKRRKEKAKKPAATPAPAPAPAQPEAAATTPSTSASESEAKAASGSSSGSTEAKTKAPEQKSKADESSYYFFKSTPKEQAAQYAPKKVTAPTPLPPEVVASGHSAWNKAGTWEERNLSKWAKSRLKAVLAGITVPPFAEGTCKVSDSWTVTVTSATCVLVRGKKKYGYEIALTSTFSGSYQGTSVSGEVKVPTFDDTDAPDEWRVNFTTNSSGEPAAVVKRAAQKAGPEVLARIEAFIKELKEQ